MWATKKSYKWILYQIKLDLSLETEMTKGGKECTF